MWESPPGRGDLGLEILTLVYIAPVPVHMAFSELSVALHPNSDDVNIPKCLQISLKKKKLFSFLISRRFLFFLTAEPRFQAFFSVLRSGPEAHFSKVPKSQLQGQN